MVNKLSLRDRMVRGSQRMTDICESFSAEPLVPFSLYAKEKFADAWGGFVADNTQVDVKCDLTFKKCVETTSPPVFGTRQITQRSYISEANAMMNINQFINRMNYSCYKHAFKRYGKRLDVVVAIEGGDNDLRENVMIKDAGKHLHTHILLQRPSHIEFEKFKILVLHNWYDTTWGNIEHKIEEIETIKGSAKYGAKSSLDNLDLTNIYYNDSSSCN